MDRQPDKILVYGIYPTPEHCGQTMNIVGNMRLHWVRYDCSKCFTMLNVRVEFDYQSEPDIADPETLLLMDIEE